MSDFFSAELDADLAISRVQQQIADAQKMAAKAEAMREDVAAVRGVATAPRRELTVTVDSGGRLLKVDVADAAYDLEPRDLGRLIVATAEQARQKAGEQAIALAAEAFGEDSGVVAHLREEIEARPSDLDDVTS